MSGSKQNLLSETIEVLKSNGKVPADVLWVGVKPHSWKKNVDPMPIGSWANFASFADFEYDAGYGGNEVAGSLLVVGTDWWLERGEYDGSEWWEFKTLPRQPTSTTPLRRADLLERL